MGLMDWYIDGLMDWWIDGLIYSTSCTSSLPVKLMIALLGFTIWDEHTLTLYSISTISYGWFLLFTTWIQPKVVK